MHTSRTLIGALGLTVALAIGGTACSTEDQTNAALEKAGVDANVSTGAKTVVATTWPWWSLPSERGGGSECPPGHRG